MGVNIDPLGDVTFIWLWDHSASLCDCPAKHNAGMKHSDMCSMTPIYRSLCMKESPTMIGLEIASARIGGTARWRCA